jgi:hypothetical protein
MPCSTSTTSTILVAATNSCGATTIPSDGYSDDGGGYSDGNSNGIIVRFYDPCKIRRYFIIRNNIPVTKTNGTILVVCVVVVIIIFILGFCFDNTIIIIIIIG